jgi:hypothetical protein
MPWSTKKPAAADVAPDWLRPYCEQFLQKLDPAHASAQPVSLPVLERQDEARSGEQPAARCDGTRITPVTLVATGGDRAPAGCGLGA